MEGIQMLMEGIQMLMDSLARAHHLLIISLTAHVVSIETESYASVLRVAHICFYVSEIANNHK